MVQSISVLLKVWTNSIKEINSYVSVKKKILVHKLEVEMYNYRDVSKWKKQVCQFTYHFITLAPSWAFRFFRINFRDSDYEPCRAEHSSALKLPKSGCANQINVRIRNTSRSKALVQHRGSEALLAVEALYKSGALWRIRCMTWSGWKAQFSMDSLAAIT